MDLDMNNLIILDKVEKNICIVENNIFGNPSINPTFGEFSVSKIKDKLSLIQAMEDLDKIQLNSVSYIRNQGYGSVLDNLGLGQSSGSLNKSLSEKKRFYFEVFDTMNENISNSKKILKKIEEEFPKNERIMQLFGRCEKCDNEVENLRKLVRDFENIVSNEVIKEKVVSSSSAPAASGGSRTLDVATLEEKAEQDKKREKENEIRQERIKEKSKRRVKLIIIITIIGIIIGTYIGGGRDMAVLGAILGVVVGGIFGYNFDNKIIGIAICGLFLGVIGYGIGLERNGSDIIINIVGGGIFFGLCSLIIAIMKIPKPYN